MSVCHAFSLLLLIMSSTIMRKAEFNYNTIILLYTTSSVGISLFEPLPILPTRLH